MRIFGATRPFDGSAGGGGGPFVLLNGSVPMTGDLNMGGNSVINQTLDIVTTPISATTAAMGLADRYTATAASITITISTADIVDGRRFVFSAEAAGTSGGTPVTIATEGAQLIDGAASVNLVVPYDSITLVARSGGLESEQ